MITIFSAIETSFDNNGLAVLDPITCNLNVTINGAWTVELEHSFDEDKKYEKIEKNCIIKITNIPIITEQTSTYQLFRIYDTVKTLTTVKAIAFPVAFEATYDAIIEELKIGNKTASAALQDIMTYLSQHGVSKYTVTSDYSMIENPRQKKGSWVDTNLIAAISGSDDGSIINSWGGEVAYDNYKIIVNGKLGQFEDPMYCNPSYRFASAFWHSQAYESGYHQRDYNYKKITGEDAIIAIDNSHNFMLVSCVSSTAVDWVWQRLEYDSASGAWIYGTWQDPIYGDQYGLYTPCYRESSFTYKGKTWWVSWGYMDTYYNTPFVTASHVLDGRSTGDIVGSAKALIDLSGWNAKQPDKYEIRYGKNLTGLSVDTDISGVVTRLYPKGSDGTRLIKTIDESEVSYVDSVAHIDDYPYVRAAFVDTPYQLIDTSFDENQINTTQAIVTHTAQTQLTDLIHGVALQFWNKIKTGLPYNSKWYEPDWVQSVLDDVIKTLQKNLTTNIEHPSWKNLLEICIKDGISWIKNVEIPDFYWEGDATNGYTYTNGERTITNQYLYVDKRYCKFGNSGLYEPPADEASFDWIQKKGSSARKKYGNNRHYMAHDEDVYITMQGTLVRYYMDEEGWYDNNEDVSDWSKHNWGTSTAWFGEDGATSSETGKYAHDTWLFIDGTYYYFNSEGYIEDQKNDYRWDWVKDKEKYWFGNKLNKEYAAIYVTDQWLKIEGEWCKFDSDGYLVKMDTLKSQLTTLLKNAINSAISEEIITQQNLLYESLYDQMIDYCEELFESGLDCPSVNITADLVELSKTEEYKDFSQFEEIHLGNEVKLHDYVHNYHFTERIIGLIYDCIRGYNIGITIDDPSKTIQLFTGSNGSKGGKLDALNNGEQMLIAGEGVSINNGVIGFDGGSGNTYNGTQVSVSQTVTTGTELAKIYINGNPVSIFAVASGSDVSITPAILTGTKIADYEIDGNEGSLYAPEGTAVEANPTGTATDTLSTILIDDTIYDIQGGGGTNVEANPSGEPTDTLLSVKIGNVIYDIPSGEVTTDIKEYAPQKYTFMYESGQDAAFSTLDGDMQIQTVLDPSYSASDYKAEIVRVVPIPTTVKKIRYRLEFGYQTYRESNTDEWKYCVGVKSTLDTTNYASPTDNDFIIKKLYRKEDYENSIIEDELILDGTTQTYLYFIGRGWNCEITKLEVVEVGTVMELSELDDVNITNPSDGQTIVFNGTSGKWENQTPSGGGGSTITYGTSEPSGSANDGDVYYLLKDDKLQATFLYKVNQWILIEGAVGREGVRIWTHSTGGNDASMWLQHGYYNPSTGVFTPDQNEIDVKYQDVYQRETTYYDMVSLYYGNWQCKAKTEMTDGTNTYAVGSMIKSWQYYESVDFTIWRTS